MSFWALLLGLMMHVCAQRANVKPQATVWICVPKVSASQYHPFTVSGVLKGTYPSEPTIAKITVKPYGSWAKVSPLLSWCVFETCTKATASCRSHMGALPSASAWQCNTSQPAQSPGQHARVSRQWCVRLWLMAPQP